LEKVIEDPKKNEKEFLKKEIEKLGKLEDKELEELAKKAKEKIEEIEQKRDEMTKRKYWIT
jgi:ribosomal protein L14E/L6E/L27E